MRELSKIEEKILASQEALLQEQIDDRYKKLATNILRDVVINKVACADMKADEYQVAFNLNGQVRMIPITISHWEDMMIKSNMTAISEKIAQKLVQEIAYLAMNQ